MTTSQEHQTYLDRALQDGLAELSGEGRVERMRYVVADHSERWSDLVEKGRAELICKYEYPPELIRFVVNIRPTRCCEGFLNFLVNTVGSRTGSVRFTVRNNL